MPATVYDPSADLKFLLRNNTKYPASRVWRSCCILGGHMQCNPLPKAAYLNPGVLEIRHAWVMANKSLTQTAFKIAVDIKKIFFFMLRCRANSKFNLL